MKPILQKLAQILEASEEVPISSELYVAGQYPWNENMVASLLDRDDPEQFDDPDEDEPVFAQQHGLKPVFLISEVQDIIVNAKQQLVNPTISDLIKAFNYYFRNDAFIDFSLS